MRTTTTVKGAHGLKLGFERFFFTHCGEQYTEWWTRGLRVDGSSNHHGRYGTGCTREYTNKYIIKKNVDRTPCRADRACSETHRVYTL